MRYAGQMNRDEQHPPATAAGDRLAALRLTYTRGGLEEREAGADPFVLFRRWLMEAIDSGLREPNAMTLATLDESGCPDARVVLLKGFDERGFGFFTNYESAKGRQLDADSRAALVFFWNDLERQVRVQGRVARMARDESAAYFATRPRESQLGAWASAQSAELPDRAALEQRYVDAQARFPGEVPLPPFWGGYRLDPRVIEFWQGRVGRLHDRLRFTRMSAGWNRTRLSP